MERDWRDPAVRHRHLYCDPTAEGRDMMPEDEERGNDGDGKARPGDARIRKRTPRKEPGMVDSDIRAISEALIRLEEQMKGMQGTFATYCKGQDDRFERTEKQSAALEGRLRAAEKFIDRAQGIMLLWPAGAALGSGIIVFILGRLFPLPH